MEKDAVLVTAQTTFLPEQSAQDIKRFLWTYEITIVNNSELIIQLLNRFWRITEMTGHMEEVRGPGVVGLQPVIKPGKKFVYNSFCQLSVPRGTMEGHYTMQTLEEESFVVLIPQFVLSAPESVSMAFRSHLH